MAPPSQSSPQPPLSNAEITSTALKTGVFTGTVGAFTGAGYGILKSSSPALLAVSHGCLFFVYGSSYIATRNSLWREWGGKENLSSSDFVKANGVAGGVTGMIAGMLRGRSNILPGMIVFSALSSTGSFLFQKWKTREPKLAPGWIDSRWSPMKRLSDKEYEEKLSEKLLRLDAEIAIIDENIESLKASRQDPGTPDDKTRR
ncbi:hypothetical protein F4809DRAFT_224038 [Biscogniauxia mediterranea]|nr:hypothetical protein F4809DRAFT_224038 [Biscogniauxia mediterranea]